MTIPPPTEDRPNGVAAELSLAEVCARLDRKVTTFLTTPAKSELVERVQKQTVISLEVIRQALDKYSFNQLSISFNGGKDCLVLLVLLLCSLHRRRRHLHLHHHHRRASAGGAGAGDDTKVASVYVMSSHPFPEVDAFVADCIGRYSLDLHRYALPMRKAFEQYLREYPEVKAVFVGTRRTDPHGENLRHFDPTDHGWPAFMRVHPVIDWHYQEVWAFLRELDIPYCSLYDMGYTSLGGTTDTHPNPLLAEKGADGGDTHFRPAYELVEDEQERLGRDR